MTRQVALESTQPQPRSWATGSLATCPIKLTAKLKHKNWLLSFELCHQVCDDTDVWRSSCWQEDILGIQALLFGGFGSGSDHGIPMWNVDGVNPFTSAEEEEAPTGVPHSAPLGSAALGQEVDLRVLAEAAWSLSPH